MLFMNIMFWIYDLVYNKEFMFYFYILIILFLIYKIIIVIFFVFDRVVNWIIFNVGNKFYKIGDDVRI